MELARAREALHVAQAQAATQRVGLEIDGRVGQAAEMRSLERQLSSVDRYLDGLVTAPRLALVA